MLRNLIRAYNSDITRIPPLLESSHLPSLDGFRGISILMVVIGHTAARIDSRFLQYIFNGSLGVYVFFVISGFLITTLLLKERVRTGTISMKNFYVRRILRIFPVAYLYLIVVFMLNRVFHLDVTPFAYLGAALYVMNFEYFQVNWYTHHYWSLSIEEQFYLLFPSLLKKNLRLYCWLIPAMLVSVPVLIFVCRHSSYLLLSPFYTVVHFLLQFDGILTGSFFAILYFKDLLPLAFFRRYKVPLNLILLAITMLIHNNHDLEAINHLSSFLIAVIVVSNLEVSDDFIFRILNHKWLVRIGVLSYSIYIWQQLFTMTRSEPTWDHLPWYHFPLNVLVLGVVAYVSYYFYEKQFLKLKSRFK